MVIEDRFVPENQLEIQQLLLKQNNDFKVDLVELVLERYCYFQSYWLNKIKARKQSIASNASSNKSGNSTRRGPKASAVKLKAKKRNQSTLNKQFKIILINVKIIVLICLHGGCRDVFVCCIQKYCLFIEKSWFSTCNGACS